MSKATDKDMTLAEAHAEAGKFAQTIRALSKLSDTADFLVAQAQLSKERTAALDDLSTRIESAQKELHKTNGAVADANAAAAKIFSDAQEQAAATLAQAKADAAASVAKAKKSVDASNATLAEKTAELVTITAQIAAATTELADLNAKIAKVRTEALARFG